MAPRFPRAFLVAVSIVVALVACFAPPPEERATPREPARELAPLRVFLRGGPKTHGPGEHDHPRFVEEWTQLLRERGASVEGALVFPSDDELARADVLVLYAADGGSIHGEERTRLERFLARGGGLVVLHDAICGDDPQWFKTVCGGAWEHGRAKYHTGTIDLYFTGEQHPITRDAANFRFEDEIYWELHLDPGIRVLGLGFHTVFDVTPQMWTFEKDGYRSFVSLQGHFHDSFEHAAWRTLLLRGIAWAGKRDADSLLKPGEADALAYPPGGPTRPELAKNELVLHPDFKLDLVAAEPLVEKPISLDWDARGRLWVAQSPGYPEKERFSKQPARDEIAILADRDGDGRMESKHVFAGGLDLVTSFVFHRDGVIASASPEILWLRDTNGDDVADAREVLFSGFGFGDTHAVVSNLRWGLDGWIYATQGYSGGDSRHVTNAAGHDFGAIGNGVFRFKPDGSAIEMVSSFGSNTWGLDFTRDGELLFSMANGAHLRHVVLADSILEQSGVADVPGWRDIADHERVEPLVVHEDAPYAQIDFVGGFTAASGCCVYDGGAWPEGWSSACFVAEPTVHLVHHDVIERDALGLKARKARNAEFLASKDLWFRPIHMRVGPDGALYVLDFYNQAVVHNDTRGPQHGPTNAALRPDRDHSHGRIWRVQHKDAKAIQVVDRSHASTGEFVSALGHPNRWAGMTALRLLVERADPAAEKELERLALHGPDAESRVQAAWCLQRLGRVGSILVRLFEDRSALVRLHAARILAADAAAIADPTISARAVRDASDDDPLLRRAALVLLASSREHAEIAVRAVAEHGDDPWTNCAAFALAASRAEQVVKYVRDWGLQPRESATETASAPSSEDVRAAAKRELYALVVRLYSRPEHRAELEKLLVESLSILDADDAFVRDVAHTMQDGNPQAPSAAVVDALRESLARARMGCGVDCAARVILLARKLGAFEPLAQPIASWTDDLAASVRASASVDTRLLSLEALLCLESTRSTALAEARDLLSSSTASDVQERVVQMIDAIDSAAAAKICIESLGSLTPKAKAAALELLLARAERAELLLHAVESKQLAPTDLGSQTAHRLRTHPSPAVAELAQRVLPLRASSAKVDELVAKLLPVASQPGEASAGKLVFEQNCAQCHSVNGVGGNIGPDLTGIGTHGARALLPVILEPNRAVEGGYSEWQLETKDGKLVTGILAREGQRSVVLRSTQGDVEVAREEIDWMRDTGRSPMPEGLESIGAEGFRDLFAYLTGDFAGWRVLDLSGVVSASGLDGLYDKERDAKPLEFARSGVVDVEGIPFEILDPRREASGCNALVLKGGWQGWDAKERSPKRVEIEVNSIVERVHVLGGVGGWASPFHDGVRPICTWTWVYDDGAREDVVLESGVQFADWIRPHDVPGSTLVEGLLSERSLGQVRRFALEPQRKDARVRSILLESPDRDEAATFFALTAELAGARRRATSSRPSATSPSSSDANATPPSSSGASATPAKPDESAAAANVPLDWLIYGGGSSHDFRRWFRDADVATLRRAGIASASYTERERELAAALPTLRALEICANQPIADADTRSAILDHVARGGGLLLLHPACWRNWPDWPEFNALLVGGGASGHGPYGEFEVNVVDPAHPIMSGMPVKFRVADELYRFEPNEPGARGSAIHVVARGRSLDGKEDFPVVWTVEREHGRTVCITLGHDGAAHESAEFRTLLVNSARWVLETSPQR